MFTGIITDVGKIQSIDLDSGKIKILSNYEYKSIDLGASICCSGICLTVTERGSFKGHSYFCVQVSSETISKSSVKFWKKNTEINLERSLKFGDEVGGHLVTGHVDCLAEVNSINKSKNSNIINIKFPDDYKKFIASKGSVCLDGISLTINDVFKNMFTVNIIPHTEDNTSWNNLNEGDSINLEFDILARYVARQLEEKK